MSQAEWKNAMRHGSNVSRSVEIIKENTLKTNKAIFYDKLLFFICDVVNFTRHMENI